MLAIDVSESMQATDVLPDRIKAAQAAAEQFADILPLEDQPRVWSSSAAPPASSCRRRPTATAVKNAIANLQLLASTAIGEAVFACLDAINTFSESNTAKGAKPAPARIVLMSDGANNKGRTVASAEAGGAQRPVSRCRRSRSAPTRARSTSRARRSRCRPTRRP